MIQPHGGKLVDRVNAQPGEELTRRAATLPSIMLNQRELADLEMIAVGAMSPLDGFMTRADYDSVLADMRLASGLVWTLPVVLAAKEPEHRKIRPGGDVALRGPGGGCLGILRVEDSFEADLELEAQRALGTTDAAHPGVAYLKTLTGHYLGGPIELIAMPPGREFEDHRLDPRRTRALFEQRGWRTIVAFQTRNPIHRAHEYLQKCALEIVDGLLVHPLVGEVKADDIPADVRMRCYEALLDGYYPRERVALTVFPAAMRYAGPREAVFHALLRQNYGCTHLIVGRDHAGVGNYYGTYDAHKIFDRFDPGDIGITPLFFDHAFFCRTCDTMASAKTCPHEAEAHVFLSGTRVRDLLKNGEMLPTEFTRPEVARILMESMAEC